MTHVTLPGVGVYLGDNSDRWCELHLQSQAPFSVNARSSVKACWRMERFTIVIREFQLFKMSKLRVGNSNVTTNQCRNNEWFLS